MSRSYSGAPNNLYNLSDNMDKSTAQQYTFDSCTTGFPSQASQTCSYISTSHIDTIEHYGCSLPPHFDTSWIASSLDLDFASLSLREGSIIGNSTEGDYTDVHCDDKNYVDGNPTLYTSFQDHRSDSGFNANDATSSQELLDYSASSKPLILELGVPSDHWSNRGRSENPSASPVTISGSIKCTNDSDTYRNSNDAKVAKTKKVHQCTDNNCGKRFGRSAELKRHKSSVHRAEERQELFNCQHEGCERVGESGFKRKDNLVQHLRGVHGDQIGKNGRRPTRTSTRPSTPNASVDSPTMVTGYEQFSQGQQEEPFVYADQQPTEEGSGTDPLPRDLEGCERVGESGSKRKDNLIQHLRGVHGDPIGKKIGRRSMRRSTWSSASNASVGSPTMATGYGQFPQGREEEELFVSADQQPTEEGSGAFSFPKDFLEGLGLESWEE